MFFYRDTHGNEVDLIIKQGRKLTPVEIKSAATFTPDFLKGIEQFRKVAEDRCKPGFVFYNGREQYTLKRNGTAVIAKCTHNKSLSSS